ncbi:MAG: hypothetical protein HQ519_06110 [Planctomycetes bacterium]|nr:hypothetical protein [Planctomycetota bacterium]
MENEQHVEEKQVQGAKDFWITCLFVIPIAIYSGYKGASGFADEDSFERFFSIGYLVVLFLCGCRIGHEFRREYIEA